MVEFEHETMTSMLQKCDSRCALGRETRSQRRPEKSVQFWILHSGLAGGVLESGSWWVEGGLWFWCWKVGVFFGSSSVAFCMQAMAAWQWYNSLAGRVAGGRRILRLNLDETSVSLFQGTGRGAVMFDRKRHHPSDEPVQTANRQKRRACMTHVAIICDDLALQPMLPQYVIGNLVVFPQRQWAALQASCPGNVVLVRQRSAWNNTRLFATILRKLGAVLRPFLCSVQPVLLMDASRIHFAQPALQACRSVSIWPVFVPAKLTWLLQPCDTHCFLGYKRVLRDVYQATRANTPGGNLTILEFMSCLYSVFRRVLQGHRWALAFDRDGYGAGQSEVSMFVKRQLQVEGALEVPVSRPSHDQLRLCFPRRARLSMGSLLPPPLPAIVLARQPVGLRLFPRRALAVAEGAPRCNVCVCGLGQIQGSWSSFSLFVQGQKPSYSCRAPQSKRN